jgi:hypothetical protein
MLEYGLAALRVFGRYPMQVLLYVGDEPARMETALRGSNLEYSYRLVDVRDLDGERLLNSDNWIAYPAIRSETGGAAGVATNCGIAAGRAAVSAGPAPDSGWTAQEAGKSGGGGGGRRGGEKGADSQRYFGHEVLGREYKKGRQEGREQGRQEGELTILRRLTEKGFGPLPASAEKRLSKLSAKEIEELSVRVLDAQSIEDLLK